MKKILLSSVVLALFAFAANADIRVPDTPTPKPTPKAARQVDSRLSIRFSSTDKEPRLIIPKSQLKQLRAELDELDSDDANASAPQAPAANVGALRLQTLLGGAFLSLAMVFGGVWFARSKRDGGAKTGKIVVGVAVVCALASAATFTLANVGPPIAARSISPRLFSDEVLRYKYASGPVKLETSATETSIVLVVPEPAAEQPSTATPDKKPE